MLYILLTALPEYREVWLFFRNNLRQVKYYKVILTATVEKARCPLFRYVNNRTYRECEQTDSTHIQR